MTVTDYVLSHLPGSPQIQPTTLATADQEIFVRCLAELGKFGSNHNQLARRRNMTGEEPDSDEWRRIDAAIQDIRGALLQALGKG